MVNAPLVCGGEVRIWLGTVQFQPPLSRLRCLRDTRIAKLRGGRLWSARVEWLAWGRWRSWLSHLSYILKWSQKVLSSSLGRLILFPLFMREFTWGNTSKSLLLTPLINPQVYRLSQGDVDEMLSAIHSISLSSKAKTYSNSYGSWPHVQSYAIDCCSSACLGSSTMGSLRERLE